MNSDVAVAAHRIHDPANPLAVHVARLLASIAITYADDTDQLCNCGACPILDAAHDLAAHINGSQP